MTRLLLLLSLFASVAFGQTYVRPSKGKPILVFSGVAVPGTLGTIQQFSDAWDWSAFEAMRIRIVATSGTNTQGYGCTGKTTQYTVADIGSFAKLYLRKTAVMARASLWVTDSTTATGSFLLSASTNSAFDLYDYMGCTISVYVTPIPFAPASVAAAVSSTTLVDGGTAGSGAQTYAPYQCSSSVQTTYVMDGGAVTIGDMSPRQYVVVCNSRENSSGTARCRADGTAPVTTAGSAGTVLAVGDCVPYTESTVQCASSSGIYVTSYECGP